MSIRFKLTFGGMLLTCVTILLTAGGYAAWLQAARQSLPAIPADAAEQLSREFLRVTAGLTLGLTVGAGALLLLFDMRMRRRMLKIVDAAAGIAAGELTQKLPVRGQDEISLVARAIEQMRETIARVLREISVAAQAIQEGRLDVRATPEGFAGDWRKLIVDMNSMIDQFAEPHRLMTGALDRLAKGDIPNRVTHDARGEFSAMIESLNRLIDAMNEVTWISIMLSTGNLDVDARERSEQDRLMKAMNKMIQQLQRISQETNLLIKAVDEGNLAVRGDAEGLGGVWRDHIIGINAVLDAFVAPFNVAATSLDLIAKGGFPEKIRDEYHGDFNALKQNLNLLIDAIHDITVVAEEMARGNLSVEVNERSEADVLMQSLNRMILRVKEVVTDVKITASDSAHYAEDVGGVVTEMVSAIEAIAGKIQIIEAIAAQTRLLSLNATIEAARVQEHGKAFSVVAAEVRQLSDITKQAAEEINQLATSSLKISQRIHDMFAALVPNIHKTAELVQALSVIERE